jgi:hypothetical protein
MKWIDWANLDVGDILTHKQSGDGYVVTQSFDGHRMVMVRTIVASNPREWDRYIKDSGPNEQPSDSESCQPCPSWQPIDSAPKDGQA